MRRAFLASMAQTLAVTALSVQRSLMSQVPPVARVGQFYNFPIASDTFSVDSSLLTYSISSAPGWIRFQNDTMSLVGTPTGSDVGRTWMQLLASDARATPGGNGTAQSSLQLMVTAASAPVFKSPLTTQLSNAASNKDGAAATSSVFPYNDGHGVRIPPGWSFSIGFAAATCTSPSGGRVLYSAITSSLDPLPAWIKFSSTALTFSGYTPPNGNTTSFEVVLICTDVVGFRAASQSFMVVVAADDHELELHDALPGITTVAHNNVSCDVRQWIVNSSQLFIDGRPVRTSDIATLDIKLSSVPTTSWLSWDSANFALVGTVPSTDDYKEGWDTPSLLPLTIRSSYDSVLETTVAFGVGPFLFTKFQYPLILTDFTPGSGGSNASVSVSSWLNVSASQLGTISLTAKFDPPEASSWMSFDANSLRLSYNSTNVIDTLPYKVVDISLSAKNATLPTSTSSTAVVTVRIAETSTSSGSPATVAGSGTSHGLARQAVIALSLAIVVLLVLLLLLYFGRSHLLACARRQRGTSAPQISISTSRSWTRTKFGVDMFGMLGGGSDAASDTKKLSIHCGSDTSHTSSWVIGTSIDMSHFSVGREHISADGHLLPVPPLDSMPMVPIGRARTTSVTKDDSVATPAKPGPHRLAMMTALDPDLSPEDHTSRPAQATGGSGQAASPPFSSSSGFAETGTSSSWESQSSYQWTRASEGDAIELQDFDRAAPPSVSTSSGALSRSERSIPRQRADFRRAPPGVRQSLKERLRAAGSRTNADVSVSNSLRLPDAFAERDSDEESDVADDASCIRVASIVPVASPIMREVAVQQVDAARSAGAQDSLRAGPTHRSLHVQRENAALPQSASQSQPEKTLFGLGYPAEALADMLPPTANTQYVDASRASPQRKTEPPAAAPSRSSSPSKDPTAAPLIVYAKVGQRFYFTPPIHPPPAMTPSSGRASPARGRFIGQRDVDGSGKELELPAWLHFDDGELAFWGVPWPDDVASVQVRVVERGGLRKADDIVVSRVLVVITR